MWGRETEEVGQASRPWMGTIGWDASLLVGAAFWGSGSWLVRRTHRGAPSGGGKGRFGMVAGRRWWRPMARLTCTRWCARSVGCALWFGPAVLQSLDWFLASFAGCGGCGPPRPRGLRLLQWWRLPVGLVWWVLVLLVGSWVRSVWWAANLQAGPLWDGRCESGHPLHCLLDGRMA